MDWLRTTLEQFQSQPVVGYVHGQSAATEPTALAALTLVAAGKFAAAGPAFDYLASSQADDGSVGIRHGEAAPGWPTSLAALAWIAAREASGRDVYQRNTNRALDWILATRGTTMPRSPEMGHDTQLVGWSWAEQTHSWIEPTAMHVLALKRAGLSEQHRVRQAVALLVDRLLPGGGCNYGNTTVLGQMLRPHVQPTGLALLALAGEHDKPEAQARDSAASANGADPRRRVGLMERSLAYLRRSAAQSITASSLAWAILGLRAHGIELPQASERLAAAYERVQAHDRSPHKLALLALASQPRALDLLVSQRGPPG
jgi:hypothetical protein